VREQVVKLLEFNFVAEADLAFVWVSTNACTVDV